MTSLAYGQSLATCFVIILMLIFFMLWQSAEPPYKLQRIATVHLFYNVEFKKKIMTENGGWYECLFTAKVDLNDTFLIARIDAPCDARHGDQFKAWFPRENLKTPPLWEDGFLITQRERSDEVLWILTGWILPPISIILLLVTLLP